MIAAISRIDVLLYGAGGFIILLALAAFALIAWACWRFVQIFSNGGDKPDDIQPVRRLRR